MINSQDVNLTAKLKDILLTVILQKIRTFNKERGLLSLNKT